MMGHLVFGRYGRDDASPLQKGRGWLQRVWQSMFSLRPNRTH